MKIKVLVLAVLFMVFGVSGASAAGFNMFSSDFNVDGVIIPTFSGSFGAITYSVPFNTSGIHYVAVFVDPEIDEPFNTFFNEYGSAVGTPAPGQTWEIDEPGFVFGDIYNNFLAGVLDNSNGVPSIAPDDVSMALGWDFSLAAGETATVRFYITPVQPTSGFYLVQTDPDSPANLYFYSTFQRGGVTVPEPGTMLLLGFGLAGLIGLGRKKFKK